MIGRIFTFKRILTGCAVALAIWATVVVALAVMIHTTGQQDEARESDVIVVLGSGLRRDGSAGDALRRRSVWAADLYGRGIAPHIICTGGVGAGQARSEAEACAEILRERGVPPDAIHTETNSRSTEENAIYAGAIIAANGWETVTLVTDSFHMLRAAWIFDNYDIEHYRSPAPRAWIRGNFYERLFVREIVALHWQAFKQTFNIPVTNLKPNG